MKYNFDKIIERENTDSVKYDLRKQMFGREDILPLWVADMDFETPDFIIDAMRKRLEHPVMAYSIRSHAYTDSIRKWINDRHGWSVNRNEISFSPGVVPGLMMAVYAFTQKQDAILVQPPVYFPFYITVRDNGRKLLYNQLRESENYYTMDFQDMERHFKAGARAIMISNPHNPVGRVWNIEELERLVELCEKYDVLIFSDEIHADLVFAPHKHIPIASISEKAAAWTITWMAASKTFNIAGLSTSFAIIQNPELMKKYKAMLEAMHLFSGNIMGSVATKAAFDYGNSWRMQMLDYVWENITFVKDFLEKSGLKIKFRLPEATFLLWLDFREMRLPQKELVDILVNRAGVGLNDGSIFSPGGEGFMRMNVAAPRVLIQSALVKMAEAFVGVL